MITLSKLSQFIQNNQISDFLYIIHSLHENNEFNNPFITKNYRIFTNDNIINVSLSNQIIKKIISLYNNVDISNMGKLLALAKNFNTYNDKCFKYILYKYYINNYNRYINGYNSNLIITFKNIILTEQNNLKHLYLECFKDIEYMKYSENAEYCDFINKIIKNQNCLMCSLNNSEWLN